MNTLIRSPSQCQNCQPGGSEASIHNRGHQETNHCQFFRFSQGYPIMFPLQGTQNLLPTSMTSTKIPQPLSRSSFLYVGETLNCMQHYFKPPLPDGAFHFRQEWPQTSSSVTTYSFQTPEPPSRTLKKEDFLFSPKEDDKPTLPVREKTLEEAVSLGKPGSRYSMAVTGDETETGSTGGLASCQLRNSTSSLPKCAAEDSAHSSQQHVEDALQKRELRLMKNREAARECRRKKKEYVRCLEQRVAVLENQNKSLIEELRALKDIYRHKVE